MNHKASSVRPKALHGNTRKQLSGVPLSKFKCNLVFVRIYIHPRASYYDRKASATQRSTPLQKMMKETDENNDAHI